MLPTSWAHEAAITAKARKVPIVDSVGGRHAIRRLAIRVQWSMAWPSTVCRPRLSSGRSRLATSTLTHFNHCRCFVWSGLSWIERELRQLSIVSRQQPPISYDGRDPRTLGPNESWRSFYLGRWFQSPSWRARSARPNLLPQRVSIEAARGADTMPCLSRGCQSRVKSLAELTDFGHEIGRADLLTDFGWGVVYGF
jgi:hypothetical protein